MGILRHPFPSHEPSFLVQGKKLALRVCCRFELCPEALLPALLPRASVSRPAVALRKGGAIWAIASFRTLTFRLVEWLLRQRVQLPRSAHLSAWMRFSRLHIDTASL